MLVELTIRDFAIIDNLSIGFGPGLNVFTGETGAGKSIIIDALSLILGDRATSDVIRTSRDEAYIEALFDTADCRHIKDLLEGAGLEYSDTLVIKRVIQRNGRNRIYINGSLATLVTLSEVGRHLVDIYGQSEHQSLTRPDEHVEVLDGFGGLGSLRREMSSAYREWLSLKRRLDDLLQGEKKSAQYIELLNFQAEEIERSRLRIGEDEELEKERNILRNTERIFEATSRAEGVIYSDTGSVTERLGSMVRDLREIADLDEGLKKAVERLEGTLYELEDLAGFFRDYAGRMEFDAGRLDEIEARLDEIGKLKRKYGSTIEEILRKKEDIERELQGIETHEERVRELREKEGLARNRALKIAGRLAEERRKVSRRLKERMEAELKDLGMGGTVFEVVFDEERDSPSHLGEKGYDRVSFHISPNPGEGLKPLSRIASGGELSRIMLAMKGISAVGRVPTVVFDEVDSGIGGSMGAVVGRKLKKISRTSQVICITHLPQIAVFADRHYHVSKYATPEGRTVSRVVELKGEQRVEDISRMLGGTHITDTTKRHARELLRTAKGD